MRFMARVFFLAAFAVGMAFPAFAAEGGYLFESNIAKFKDIKNRKRWRSLSLNGICITKIGVSPYLSTIHCGNLIRIM